MTIGYRWAIDGDGSGFGWGSSVTTEGYTYSAGRMTYHTGVTGKTAGREKRTTKKGGRSRPLIVANSAA
jgi:hypothetical protein